MVIVNDIVVQVALRGRGEVYRVYLISRNKNINNTKSKFQSKNEKDTDTKQPYFV